APVFAPVAPSNRPATFAAVAVPGTNFDCSISEDAGPADAVCFAVSPLAVQIPAVRKYERALTIRFGVLEFANELSSIRSRHSALTVREAVFEMTDELRSILEC